MQYTSELTNFSEKKATLEQRKKNLWKMIAVSSGFDILMAFVELPFIEFLGAPIIIDELIGFFLSKWAAGTSIDLKMRSRLLGLIPIPGVTAISLQCLKELWEVNRALKALEKGDN